MPDLTGSFVKSEPAIAASIASAIVGFTVTTLQTHGVISGIQASGTTKILEPAVTALALLLLGVLLRFVVAPAAQFEKRVQAEVQRRLSSIEGTTVASSVALTVDPPFNTTPPTQSSAVALI